MHLGDHTRPRTRHTPWRDRDHRVAVDVNWKDGDDVIISPAISDSDAKVKFPKGFTTLTSYLRLTPQPNK